MRLLFPIYCNTLASSLIPFVSITFRKVSFVNQRFLIALGLTFTRQPYYMLSAIFGLADLDLADEEERTIVKDVLIEICSHEVGIVGDQFPFASLTSLSVYLLYHQPLMDSAFSAVKGYLTAEDDKETVIGFLEHPTASVRDQALQWVKDNLNDYDTADLAFLMLEADLSPKVVDATTTLMAEHQESINKSELSWPSFVLEGDPTPLPSLVDFNRMISLRFVMS